MHEIFIYMISYAVIVFGSLFFYNFLSKGYLLKLIRIKSMRGKGILIHVLSALEYYYVVGKLEGDFLVYNDRESKANKQKTPKRVSIKKGAFYRSLGVWNVNIDEATNSIIMPPGDVVSGFDAIKYNNLYERALFKPSPEAKDKILIIIILIVVIITLLVCAAVLVQTGKVQTALSVVNSVGRVPSVNI